MNVIVKKNNQDPFSQSDRLNPIGGGKGDAPRPMKRKTFESNFEDIFGRWKSRKPGKTVYR
jgi:hypothetical protein